VFYAVASSAMEDTAGVPLLPYPVLYSL